MIELLIVVAIIAILAAIAIPNFLEAQTRSKISRTKADIRTQSLAMESYMIDWRVYPRDSDSSLDTLDAKCSDPDTCPDYLHIANGAVQLTTPVAYMTSLFTDPFVTQVRIAGAGGIGYRIGSGAWSYDAENLPNQVDHQNSHLVFAQTGPIQAYVIIGVAPDGNRNRVGYKCFPFTPADIATEGPQGRPIDAIIEGQGVPGCYVDYDPTNGTTSIGDIHRFGGDYLMGRFCQNGQWIGQQSPVGGAAQ